MITECQHHRQCVRTRHTFTQRTLTNESGLLSLSPSPIIRRRTPLPHAIRRIANTPTFSTADPSLTTFLRFPPEIRIPIYRLLLKIDGVIEYGICPVKQRLVARRCPYRSWTRHCVFPSILECCRMTNQEGSAVLYGENWFRFDYWQNSAYRRVLETWGPGRANLDSITMLCLSYASWNTCAQDRKVLDKIDLLPGVREVSVYFVDMLVEQWEAFLVEACDRLRRMKKVKLEIFVSQAAGTVICQREWPAFQNTVTDRCLWTYQQPFNKHEGIWRNREVRWEFDECTDDYERCHCVLGNLTVFLE